MSDIKDNGYIIKIIKNYIDFIHGSNFGFKKCVIEDLLEKEGLIKECYKLNKNIRKIENDFVITPENCDEKRKYCYNPSDIEDPKEFIKSIYLDKDILLKIKDCNKIYKLCIDAKQDPSYIIPVEGLTEELVECLNKLIKGKVIFDEEKKGAELGLDKDNINKRIQECKNKDKCIRINRLLLEQRGLKKQPKIRSPKGLRHFISALDEYDQYASTKQIEHLNSSRFSCESALSIEKDNTIFFGLLHNIACAYFSEERYEEANKMFEGAARLIPTAPSFCGWGFCLRELLHFRKAIDAAKKAIYLDRLLASPWYLLGAIYLDLGCYASDLYDKSIAYFSIAIEREREYFYPWLYLGIIFYRKAALQKELEKRENSGEIWGKYNKIALCCIEKAIDISKYDYPKFPSVKVQKAACLIQRGRDRDKWDAEMLLIDPLTKHVFNRAAEESLSKRTDLALRYLKEAFEKKKASKVVVLFEPDFDEIRTKEKEKLMEIFSEHPDDKDALNEIREILSKEEDCYILASFEAICGNADKAIDLLYKEKTKNKGNWEHYEKRLLTDRHFESLVDFMLEKYKVVQAMLNGFDNINLLQATPEQHLEAITKAKNYILSLWDGKNRYVQAVNELCKSYSILKKHETAQEIKKMLPFNREVCFALLKTNGIDAVEIPNICFFYEEFLKEVEGKNTEESPS